ncbi:hypothetical protein E5288_WYG003975 [Bos mutus]|uniref:Lipocalin/cytosolic fatty-acid binding domain-containing protein n=1 Tax=Bos mutus TaxID=72004 RepID=A0A6B0S5L5_9CETA|nr:hypothetical protein [Bos mutus]
MHAVRFPVGRPGGHSDLGLTLVHSQRADGCNRADAEYLRVGAQGHFRVPALGYLDVRVVDTDYSSFAVVYIYKELEGALSTMVQLYSRTQEASPQALEAFQDFYPTVGLPADMVAMLPKSGRREIHVVDTDYEQYAILRVSLQWQNHEFYVFKYFTRSLGGECEPGFLKFRELTTDMGLYLVGRHGRCAMLLKEDLT